LISTLKLYYIPKPKWLIMKMTIGLSIKPCTLNAKLIYCVYCESGL